MLNYVRFLGINVIKDVQDLHTEYNISKRKQRRSKQMERQPCSWIGRLKIVKISVLCKLIYGFSAIPVGCFYGIWQDDSTRQGNSQDALKKEQH